MLLPHMQVQGSSGFPSGFVMPCDGLEFRPLIPGTRASAVILGINERNEVTFMFWFYILVDYQKANEHCIRTRNFKNMHEGRKENECAKKIKVSESNDRC